MELTNAKKELFYLCNRKRCGDKCSYPECKHTPSIKHAKNRFRFFYIRNLKNYDYIGFDENNNIALYFEKEKN